MKVTIKAYEFMSNLYLNIKEADFAQETWEHKEYIKTVYLSIEESELESIQRERLVKNRVDRLAWLNLTRFSSKELADQETETENNFSLNF